MGEDKSQLVCEPGEAPLYKIQLAKLRQLTALPVLLSLRPGQEFRDLPQNIETVVDRVEGQGPLSALASCLENTHADYLVVLAVDLPRMSTAYLRHLIAEAHQSGCGVVPQMNGHWEPLAAVYPRTLLAKVQSHLAAGQLSLQKFIKEALREGSILAREVADHEKPLFANLNTQQDLEKLNQGELEPFDIQRWEKQAYTINAAGFSSSIKPDLIAVEEPVEIRVEGEGIAILMRTPGHDQELAAGFLLAENVIRNADDLFEISTCQNQQADGGPQGKTLDVLLKNGSSTDLSALSRHIFTSSSCGVCSKTTIESVFQSFPPLAKGTMQVSASDLLLLPSLLSLHQKNFHHSGGLHASALFTPGGVLQIIREDVGRHNALDKVIGNALLNDTLPLSNTILLLSGRVSFELMQKALAAGIPFVAGLSAPSSLAIKFARQSGQTLVGFLRGKSFNIYASKHRIHQ